MGEGIELVYKSPDDSFEAWMEDAKKEFEEKHEGVTVKITPIDSNEGDYPNKTILMMMGPPAVLSKGVFLHHENQQDYLLIPL